MPGRRNGIVIRVLSAADGIVGSTAQRACADPAPGVLLLLVRVRHRWDKILLSGVSRNCGSKIVLVA